MNVWHLGVISWVTMASIIDVEVGITIFVEETFAYDISVHHFFNYGICVVSRRD